MRPNWIKDEKRYKTKEVEAIGISRAMKEHGAAQKQQTAAKRRFDEASGDRKHLTDDACLRDVGRRRKGKSGTHCCGNTMKEHGVGQGWQTDTNGHYKVSSCCGQYLINDVCISPADMPLAYKMRRRGCTSKEEEQGINPAASLRQRVFAHKERSCVLHGRFARSLRGWVGVLAGVLCVGGFLSAGVNSFGQGPILQVEYPYRKELRFSPAWFGAIVLPPGKMTAQVQVRFV